MLEEQIMNDYKQAMKDKNAVKSSTLSFLRSQMKYAMIEKRLEKLPDDDIVAVIKKQVKQRQDSIASFQQGGREDLASKEQAELDILKSYLPPELCTEDIRKVIDQSLAETQAKSVKDMGRVMKIVLPQLAGKADGKLVSDLVKEQLMKM